MGGAAIAGVSNPINPFLEVRHIASIMNAARSTVLVTCSSADRAWYWLTNSRYRCEFKRALVDPLPEVATPATTSSVLWQSTAAVSTDHAASDDPDRVCAYFRTGGTTAAPKLVQHTQRGQLLNAWISGALLGPERDEVVGQGMPNFHVGGAILTNLRALIMGQDTTDADARRVPDRRGGVEVLGNRPAARHHVGARGPHHMRGALRRRDATSTGHTIRTFSTGGGAMPRAILREYSKSGSASL